MLLVEPRDRSCCLPITFEKKLERTAAWRLRLWRKIDQLGIIAFGTGLRMRRKESLPLCNEQGVAINSEKKAFDTIHFTMRSQRVQIVDSESERPENRITKQ